MMHDVKEFTVENDLRFEYTHSNFDKDEPIRYGVTSKVPFYETDAGYQTQQWTDVA